MRKLIVAVFFLMVCAFAAAQTAPQPCSAIKPDPAKMQKPSPPGCADIQFSDGKRAVIQYSRPRIRDPKTGQPRTIWGGLNPWGEVWRAGANEATSLVTDTDLTIGDTKIPAGSYTLFILPEKEQQNRPWKLIVSKKTGEWGIPYPGEQFDFARIDMQVSQLPDTVQEFTISFDKKSGNAASLNFDWEKTRATVKVSDTTTGVPVAP